MRRWSFFLSIVAPLATSQVIAADLEVRIADVREPTGQLMIQLLGSREAFDGKAPAVASLVLPSGRKDVRFVTDALTEGRYAIRVMHDQNGNGSLDSNAIGMPIEPWGFSNDAAGTFGPPSFDDAAFDLGADGASITIHLNH